jgi:hypothetical protein
MVYRCQGYDAKREPTSFLAVLRIFLCRVVSSRIRAKEKRPLVTCGVLLLQFLDVRAFEDIVLSVGHLFGGG